MLIAREACDLAGMDPDRLNEAVARGDFPCAPNAIPGGRRLFGENDFLGLAIFGALTAREVRPRMAGDAACRAMSEAERTPDAAALAILWRHSRHRGPVIEEITPDLKYALREMLVPKVSEVASGDRRAVQRAGFPLFSVEIINVAALRAKFRVRVLEKKEEPAPDLYEIAAEAAEAVNAAWKKAFIE